MEKWEPQDGVNPNNACPGCGYDADKDLSKMKLNETFSCMMCRLDGYDDNGYMYLGDGDFARCEYLTCPHCKNNHHYPYAYYLGFDKNKNRNEGYDCKTCNKKFYLND